MRSGERREVVLKPGVRLLGVRPELIIAVIAAKGIWEKHGGPFVITSVIDGIHSRSSEHYNGSAIDIRKLPNPEQMAQAVRELKAALGSDYLVLHESIGTPNEHCHCHFDPAESY